MSRTSIRDNRIGLVLFIACLLTGLATLWGDLAVWGGIYTSSLEPALSLECVDICQPYEAQEINFQCFCATPSEDTP